jgi:predicted metalloprotease with PDZ domain
MQDEHHWIEEGIATYVEPIARVQAGQFSASRMWFELVRDMPKGLPQSGDEGLDHTHTWGRTYWGGALFCFLADVEIRKQTQNKKGLQDALRAILNAGGNMLYDWPIEKALQTGDRAAGVEVLLELYEQMRDRPMQVDLDSLWKQLGIRVENGAAQFNDQAPLAKIREAVSAPKPQS